MNKLNVKYELLYAAFFPKQRRVFQSVETLLGYSLRKLSILKEQTNLVRLN